MFLFLLYNESKEFVIKRSNTMQPSPMITLSNGMQMPQLGLGTWKSNPGEVRMAVLHAIRCGYRHIDCAWCYKNQEEVGEGIREAISSGIVTREDLWVTSKLWNTFHAQDVVEDHLRDTLTQLKLDYVDLFLVHWPVTGVESETVTPPLCETWKGMEAVLAKGLSKAIGVSNYGIKKLEDLQSYATVMPVVNQVEMHPLCRQDELMTRCATLGIHITAYSPLGTPDSADMLKRAGPVLLDHPIIARIAEQTGHSAGQVLIRWGLQRGTSVIPKSVTPSRIEENIDMFTWELSPEHVQALSSLEPQLRMLDGTFNTKPGGPYRTVEELWA